MNIKNMLNIKIQPPQFLKWCEVYLLDDATSSLELFNYLAFE